MPQAWLQRDGMPPELAERLEHLATLPYPNRVDAVDQARALLAVFDITRSLRRAESEIAHLDDGLLPSSPERAGELERRRSTFAGLRALDVSFALADGCIRHDIALAAGISIDDVDELAARAPEPES
jgi:hypothetical protein